MVKFAADAPAAVRIMRTDRRRRWDRGRRSIIGRSLEKKLTVLSYVVVEWAKRPGVLRSNCGLARRDGRRRPKGGRGVPRTGRCLENVQEFNLPGLISRSAREELERSREAAQRPLLALSP